MTSHYKVSLFASLFIAVLFTGYPIAGAFGQILRLDSYVASYSFRTIVIILCVATFFIGTFRKTFRIPVTITIFMVMYLIRILYDYSRIGFPTAQKDAIFYIAVSFIPAISMGVIYSYFEQRLVGVAMTFMGAFACLVILWAMQSNIGIFGQLDFSNRAALDALNPVTIGYTGFITAFSAILLFQYDNWSRRFWVLIPISALGAFVLVLGGSRGPLVSAALFAVLYIFIRPKRSLPFVAAIGATFALFLLGGNDLVLFRRFQEMSNDPSILERQYFQELALASFFENPITGLAYLEPSTQSYPHNLLIESGMAMGVIGIVLMTFIQIKLLTNSLYFLKSGESFLSFICITAIARAWTSGSLYASFDFYISTILSFMVTSMMKRNDRQRQDVTGGS